MKSTEACTNGHRHAKTSARRDRGGFPDQHAARQNFGLLSIESQRGRVDAVPEAGRPRAIVEHVSEMRAAVRAFNFGPPHEQTAVHLLPDPLFPERLPEARPSGPRIELGLRREEFSAADDAPVDPVFVVVPIFTGKGPLGPLVHGDLVLDWRQALPQPRLVKLLHVELPPPKGFKVSDPSDCESLPTTALAPRPKSGLPPQILSTSLASGWEHGDPTKTKQARPSDGTAEEHELRELQRPTRGGA